jgi:hypothetical protein
VWWRWRLQGLAMSHKNQPMRQGVKITMGALAVFKLQCKSIHCQDTVRPGKIIESRVFTALAMN